ncbi:MAG: hydrogenase expression/formation protein HypD [Thermodesulfobacteriota bacterium]|nr:hydrogenase expression/formation protein HypD [Thermodesulfobacteriota bacterium]
MNAPMEGITARALTREIQEWCDKAPSPVTFMEVCGTHTMAIHQAGLKKLFPEKLRLVSGPGCPVCVTEQTFIDEAILMAKRHNATLITFGDLIRVPGSLGSLANYRAAGGDVRVVYSPMDSLSVAANVAPRPAVFLGVGFETTVPTIAITLKAALQNDVSNLYCLCAFKTIHEPLRVLAQRPQLNGFLLPGHVSAIIGTDCYQYLPREFGKPGVVAGFEPLDILLAMRDLVRLAVQESPDIINDYKRVVRPKGNETALAILAEVFDPCDASWRGLGVIPKSGLALKGPYERFDAHAKLPVDVPVSHDDPRCKCAAIITGAMTPNKCGLFGKDCTPDNPVGPCMVSSEGTCAAYYKYGA